MEYPNILKIQVPFLIPNEIEITLYSGMTFFIGPNGSGKTQTLKALRDSLRQQFSFKEVKYLSSNRMGEMEPYRSYTGTYLHSPNDYSVGNTSKKNNRFQLETASGEFFTMDDKKDVYIKVSERLSVLFNRHISLRWDAGNLKVYFEKTRVQKEYSVVAEASGLINLISILVALYDDETKVLLIDEPEVSLHPQMQSYLLREMQKSAKRGKTIIVSTHSTEMIAMEKTSGFSNFVFFEEDKSPIQVSPDSSELKAEKLSEFLPRMGQIYKNGFFAKKILLVEGASDSIICHALANKLDLNIDVAGAHIIPIDGKGQFPVIAKLFRLIHKDVAILTDLDGFIDNNNIVDLFTNLPQATQLANEIGSGSLSELVRCIKSDISEMVTKNKDDIPLIYQTHPYWMDQTADEIKKVKRAIIGQMFSVNDSDMEQWPEHNKWKSIKTRLESIFSYLEQVGCFILRKGALESYYQSASKFAYEGKPSEAIIEAGRIESETVDIIKKKYTDIIRPLQFVALTQAIDESHTVREALLGELPVFLEILRSNKNVKENDLNVVIKQGRNNTSSIFEYTILHEHDKLGIRVDIKSNIINVNGFPFDIYLGDNVNDVVAQKITNS